MIAAACAGCHSSVEVTGDAGTGYDVEGTGGRDAMERELCARFVGEGTLYARSVFDDYVRATYSFEYATSEDVETTNNDWDLLFSDNMFIVNMVVDDESLVVDLGEVGFGAVPEMVRPDDYPLGMFDEHDCVMVLEGHAYWIRTADDNTRQVAVVRIVEHAVSDTVTFQWVRSTHPDRFVLPPEECFD
jgi:hypothetical protein